MNAQAPNAVDVDRDSITRELEQLGEVTQVAGEAGQTRDNGAMEGSSEAATINWDEALGGAMEMFCAIVAPNWALDDEEKALIVNQGARVIEAFWPDLRLDQKWLLLAFFVLSLSNVVMKRYDDEAGAFIPLRKPKEAQQDSSTQRVVDGDEGRVSASPPSSSSSSIPAAPLARVSG